MRKDGSSTIEKAQLNLCSSAEGPDRVASESALLLWVCRKVGSIEAAAAAGGEKSSHPLCQC